ncbi:murein hydrolase activator EnvC family protein [Sphingomonas sp. RS2018]
MRARTLILVGSALLLGAAAPPAVVDQRARLAAARAASEAAVIRAAQFDRAAAAERDEARAASAREAAVAARVRAAEADIAAAGAQLVLANRALATQRERLAARQAPVERLLAALQSLARRPAAIAIAQPGSIDDTVRVLAMLGTMMPIVRQRSAGVRADLSQAATLRAAASTAAADLAAGHARLQAERLALVRLEGEHRARGADLARNAMFESERAIALGERARDLVDGIAADADAATMRARLAALPGPLPRPAGLGAGEAPVRFVMPPYRLPVAGRIVEGLGELSPAGVRARGLTLATAPGASVVAPAAGRVMFARVFRDYGVVVIIDHGGGWSSALTGLDSAAVTVGQQVAAGAAIGRAAMRDDPRVGVELRRRGVPVDVAQLLG